MLIGDASNVYGHTVERNVALRDMNNRGRMLMTADGILPGLLPGVTNAFPDFLSANAPDQFSGGDIRVNEQMGLLAIRTLWVREHNRRAWQLQQAFPTATDEQLYQMARKIVTAEIQGITYKEFLPILIGTEAPDLAAYSGFNPNVNPGVAQEFSACAFRVGHTFLSERLLFHDGNNVVGSESLINLFFTPGSVRQNPLLIDQVLIGQTINPANEADTKVIPAVRDNLFGLPVSKVGRDLVVFNIMRGRDHGLPRYNAMREGLGLTRKNNFNEITTNSLIATELSQAYNGDIDLCDPWICGLAEDPVAGGELGQLFAVVIADQFQRFMDGDRFFYLNDSDVRDQSLLNIGINVDTITLADVLNANTIGGVGPDAMLA
jgi:peroxidase